MPDKTGRFSRQERVFVEQMAATADPHFAAARAGYASPIKGASAALKRPEVVAAIQARVAEKLKTRGAEIGVDTLIEIAGDKGSPAASRVMAAKALVQLSGIGAGEGDRPPELHEMNREQLVDAANAARAYLAELDRPLIEGEILPAGGVFD